MINNSGRFGKRASDGLGILSQADKFNQAVYPIPKIDSFAVTDGSYVPYDDTAADTAGGQTIVIYGSGFRSGATVMVGTTVISVVTVLGNDRITFTSPALSSGSYTIYVTNTNGGTGILLPGLVYSGLPTWTTSAGSLGSAYETTAVSTSLSATGDAPVTYSLYSGTLPSGVTLSSSGVLSGTAPADTGSTTYSFTIRASDAQNQDSDRSFNLTINTDVVTWNSPADGTTYTSYEFVPFANITANATSAAGSTISYSANALPSGLSIAGNVIYGTSTVVANTASNITANAVTTTRKAYRNLNFVVNQDSVTWSSPADGTTYGLVANSAMSNVTLSATSAAGFGIVYTANTLPSNITLSSGTISGVPNVAGNTTTLVTATSSTTNRSSTRTINWTVTLQLIVNYWKQVTMALKANVTSTTSAVADASANNLTLTLNGDATPQINNPYRDGFYSVQFDGTGDYLTASPTALGSGDFTIEFWMYQLSDESHIFTYGSTWGDTAGVQMIYYATSSNYRVSVGAASNTTFGSIIKGRWVHVAIARKSGTVKVFFGGVASATTLSDTTNLSSNTLNIGYAGTPTWSAFSGYISNFRMISGVALYTTNFTVTTAPLQAITNTVVLACASPRVIDKSQVNITVTPFGDAKVAHASPFTPVYTASPVSSYSAFFNGSSDYFTTSSSTAFAFGTGDFTIEAWVYTNSSSTQRIVSLGTGNNEEFLLVNSSSSVYLDYYDGVADITSGSNYVPQNQWVHVAVSRASNAVKLFINGVLSGSGTSSVNHTTAQVAYLGRYGASALHYFSGYISNLRIVKGTAVYTAAFTPSTTALTAVTNTQLLTFQDVAVVDRSANAFTVTPNGSAAATNYHPFTTSAVVLPQTQYSYYLNGGSALRFAKATATDLSTGVFTIECWIFVPLGAGGNPRIISNTDWNGTAGYDVAIEGGAVQFRSGGAVSKSCTFASQDYGRWVHLAFTRTGTTFRVFKNGIIQNTYTDSTNLTSANPTTIGSQGGAGYPSDLFYGYIANLRVVKGTAVYTANFIPSASPLTAITGTGLLTCQTLTFVDSSANNLTPTVYGSLASSLLVPSQTYSGLDVSTLGSIYLDGTGDYVYNTSFNSQPTANFTVEAWIYLTVNATNTYYILWTFGNEATSRISLWTYNGTIGYTLFGGANNSLGGSATFLNQWNHVAFARSSTTLSGYINGVSTGTTLTLSGTLGNTAGFYIGALSNGNNAMTGYISGFRYVRGTAVYTATTPFVYNTLTAITNTQLLTFQYSGILNNKRITDGSALQNTIGRAGNSAPSTFSPYSQTGWSTYFNGSSDYLTIASNSVFDFGTGDFTIEAWVYPTTLSAGGGGASNQSMVFSVFPTTGTITGYSFGYTTSGYLMFDTFVSGTEQSITTSSNALAVGTWYHVAVTRAGGTFRMFVNGISATFTGSISQAVNGGSNSARIGALLYTTYYDYLSGHISNLRVINGTALYTLSFVPSTATLPAVTNTSLLTLQDNRLVDNSGYRHTISVSGTPRIEHFSPNDAAIVTPYYSTYFDGTGDYLTLPSNDVFAMGTSSFTIEFWVYTSNVAQTGYILQTNTGTPAASLYVSFSSSTLRLTDQATVYASTPTLSNNTWYHIAVVRSGTGSNQTVIYTNGVAGTTATCSQSFTQASPTIGGNSFIGFISNLRITKGQALYTTTFTPSTTPLTTTSQSATAVNVSLLTCQSATTIDNSSNAFAITAAGDTKPTIVAPFTANIVSSVDYSITTNSGSVYFDGTGDYLTLPFNGPAILSSSDFTIEAWIYPTTYSGTTQVIACGQSDLSTAAGSSWVLYISSTATSDSYSSSTAIAPASPNPVKNQWSHIAYVRSGTSLNTYLNGVQVGSASFASATTAVNNGTTTYVPSIGAFANGTSPFAGYISDLRIVRGTALYTANFYPPVAALSAITSTILLVNGNGGSIIDYAGKNSVETLGDAKVSALTPYASGYSMYFDGTGDYLSSPLVNNFSFGTGDFTVEFWMNASAAGTYVAVVGTQSISGSATAGMWRVSNRLNSVNGIYFNYTTGSGFTDVTFTTTNYNDSTWRHVAVTRASNVLRAFVGGTQVGSNVAITQSLTSNQSLYVGYQAQDSVYYTGYIADLRITRGYAWYTTAFTAPTSSFITK